MKNQHYFTLSTLVLSACERNQDAKYDALSLDTGYINQDDTGKPFPVDDTRISDTGRDTGLFDTGVFDTGIYDSGSWDTSREDSGLDSGSLDTSTYSVDAWCSSTTVPESIPFVRLLPNHYALVDSDAFFETNTGSRSAPFITDSAYTITDTYGCSCERILACKPSDRISEEYAFGCTEGTMKDWVAQRGWAARCSE